MCAVNEDDCPENSHCSNYELKTEYSCNCNEGYFESPIATGLVSLNALPNNGTICAPIKQQQFTDYSIDYVVSRYQMEFYAGRQYCASIGEHEAKVKNVVKSAWVFIAPDSVEEDQWLADLIGFDSENYNPYRHAAWLGIAHTKNFGWYRYDGAPISYDNFDQSYENREALAEFVNFNGNHTWRITDYSLSRAYVVCKKANLEMHQIHLSNELFYVPLLPKTWSMQFYLKLEWPQIKDHTKPNILYLTDDSSSRDPYPAIFVQNNTELTFCYGDINLCITSNMLEFAQWHNILIFTRDEGTFEVFINNECIGVLSIVPVVVKNVVALGAAPWYRFRRGAIAHMQHSSLAGRPVPTPEPTIDATVSNCLQDELDAFCRNLQEEDISENISCSNQRYARFDGVAWRCFSNLRGKQQRTLSCVDELGSLIFCQEGHLQGGSCSLHSRIETLISTSSCGITTTTTTTIKTTAIMTHGTWESWDSWSPCNAQQCEIGIRQRVRYCSESQCDGSSKQIQFCQVASDRCEFGCNPSWKSTNGAGCDLYHPDACSSNGLNLAHLKLNITIDSENKQEIDDFIAETVPVLNGQWVDSNGITALVCPACDCAATWSSFGSWSRCSNSCGSEGTKTQSRQCHGGIPGEVGCEGNSTAKRSCNRNPCRKLLYFKYHEFVFILYHMTTWWRFLCIFSLIKQKTCSATYITTCNDQKHSSVDSMEYWHDAVIYGHSYQFTPAQSLTECFNRCLSSMKCRGIQYTVSVFGEKKCNLKGKVTNWHQSTSFPTTIVAIKCGYIPEANRFAIRLADAVYSTVNRFTELNQNTLKMQVEEVNTQCNALEQYTLDLEHNCDGWHDVSKDTCLQFCLDNELPNGCQILSSPTCSYAIWTAHRDRPSRCHLAAHCTVETNNFSILFKKKQG